MAVRKYKPTTPGRRGASVSSFEEITRAKPEKSLVAKGRNRAGRNSQGRITTRHQGGGNKRRYRVIDFRRNKDGVPAKVAHIEYDPNRTARIALLHYADGEKRYILAPNGLRSATGSMSGEGADIRPGNALPLRNIPVGTTVHAVELKPGAGARMARSAGTSIQVMAKEGRYATLRLPSGRDAPGPGDLQGNGRRGRQRRARADPARQGGPQPVEAQAPVGPRCRDEPGRPPARRRRGQELGRPPPHEPVGQEGRPHAEEEQGVEQAASSGAAGRGVARCRGHQEGPVRRRAPHGQDRRDEPARATRRSSGPGRAVRRSCPRWWATRSRCTTAASTSPCTSRSRWSGTSSASSRRPGRSARTRAASARPSGEGRRRWKPRRPSKYVRISPHEGAAGGRPHPRPAGRRGPPRSCGSPRSARPRTIEKALNSAVANAEQQPGVVAAEPGRRARLGRRGADAEALAPARLRPGDEDPQAHVAHHAGRSVVGRGRVVGHKVNPYGFRLGVIYPWKSNWYAGRDYATSCTRTSGSASTSARACRARASRASTSSARATRSGSTSAPPARAS